MRERVTDDQKYVSKFVIRAAREILLGQGGHQVTKPDIGYNC